MASLQGRLWLRSRRDGAAWLRSCKPAARGRRRLYVRDRPHQTDKSTGSVDHGQHGGVSLSWPSGRSACSFDPPASHLGTRPLPVCRVRAARGFSPHARRSFFERVHGLGILLISLGPGAHMREAQVLEGAIDCVVRQYAARGSC